MRNPKKKIVWKQVKNVILMYWWERKPKQTRNWVPVCFNLVNYLCFFFLFYNKLTFILQLFRHGYLWACSSGERKNGQTLLCTESNEHPWCHSTEARATCAQWKISLERGQPPLFDQTVSYCIFLINLAHI